MTEESFTTQTQLSKGEPDVDFAIQLVEEKVSQLRTNTGPSGSKSCNGVAMVRPANGVRVKWDNKADTLTHSLL